MVRMPLHAAIGTTAVLRVTRCAWVSTATFYVLIISAQGSRATLAHSLAQGEEGRQQRPRAPNRKPSLVLLFGAALSRLLSRLHTAVLATGRVAWQLGGEAVHSLPKVAVQARDNAVESLARR